jgi:hypothetical protein
MDQKQSIAIVSSIVSCSSTATLDWRDIYEQDLCPIPNVLWFSRSQIEFQNNFISNRKSHQIKAQ